jgi:NAD(P)H-dependent flavin oxidoreductase YrpB (nitropropane dioxygenase family)
MTAVESTKLLQKWFSHTTSPFIANAPMLGFTDPEMANAVNQAGGLGMLDISLKPNTKKKFQDHNYNTKSIGSLG